MKQYDLLIIDDEQRFADMLAKRLNLRGCNCEVCYSGREALNTLKRKNFSLIILDLHLPDLYGSEVLTRLKKIDAQIPVIILTAHGTQKDRQECMQKGAYDFMQKPLVIEKLMTILAQLGEKSA
ncbi:MAG: response regulator [Desulfobacterales bacterium]|jgi:DNA-binding NtrC family response regulator